MRFTDRGAKNLAQPKETIMQLNPRSVLFLGTLAAALALQGTHAQAPATGAIRPLVVQQVDESARVTLERNTRPEANAHNDRGAVADDFPMEHMLLQLKRSAEQEKALDQLIDELHRKGSPNFHHWLTAPEFGQRFGLAKQDVNAVGHWLESHGFRVNLVYPSGTLIDFSGTAG
jgi:hypothetical protein